MSTAKGVRVVGYYDCPGGGQVVVRENVAYVGHVKPPNGTSIIDIADPANPRELAHITVPEGTLSHKVRVENDVMLVNREVFPIGRVDSKFRGGLEVFDVSKPSKPRHITTWTARGMHRFTFDGRYAYGSPEFDGYLGNVVAIIDFNDPANPQEVGRWWMPGQWIAGGEKPSWEGTAHRCHHPIRVGNRLYTSYWHGGFVILGIDDIAKPKFISGLDWSPPFPWPTHTALPIPFQVRGRRIMLVADEDVVRLEMSAPAFLWIVDIANPHAPREVASFMPDVPPGATRVQSNDVCFDDRGLIYLIDRTRGLHILERT